MGKLKLAIAISIVYLFIFPSSLSAELTKCNIDIIRIAFLNGYANAIRSDMGTIQALKKDRGKMRQLSQRAVNSYLEKVCSLNGGENASTLFVIY